MTRVSTAGQSQILIQAMLRNQARTFEDQVQITTGKKAQDFGDLGNDAVTALGARAFRDRTGTFRDVIKIVEGRLSANDVQLGGILDIARDLRNEILTIIAQDQALSFDEVLKSAFGAISSALNTKIGGQFIFAGSKTDVPPMTSNLISDLIAATAAGDLIINDQKPALARISDSVELQFGLLASDIATELFDSIKRLAEFDVGVDGPFEGPLTLVQRTFLEGELALLDQAIDTSQRVQVENGLRQNRILAIDQQHIDTEGFLEVFISEVEDVNLAEAISRLNLDQTALEASFRTFGALSNLNLLRFI